MNYIDKINTINFKNREHYIEKTDNSFNKYICPLKYKDIYKNVSKIYAIGDIHGDCNVLIKLLKKIKLINDNLDWIGMDSHLVQLGDILDGKLRYEITTDCKMDESMALEEFIILELLNKLDYQARKKGGRVHYIIGNHEIMNILGDFSYVSQPHMTDIPDQLRRILFTPGGYMAQSLACHSYSVLKINDWIFCHGGLLPSHLKKKKKKKKSYKKYIRRINSLLRKILLNEKNINDLTKFEKNIILGTDGLYWTRHYKFDPNRCKTLSNTLEIINNDRNKGGMVLGHTPHSNITSDCNNRLFFVDIGLSKAFHESEFSKLEALLIEKDKPPIVVS